MHGGSILTIIDMQSQWDIVGAASQKNKQNNNKTNKFVWKNSSENSISMYIIDFHTTPYNLWAWRKPSKSTNCKFVTVIARKHADKNSGVLQFSCHCWECLWHSGTCLVRPQWEVRSLPTKDQLQYSMYCCKIDQGTAQDHPPKSSVARVGAWPQRFRSVQLRVFAWNILKPWKNWKTIKAQRTKRRIIMLDPNISAIKSSTCICSSIHTVI